MAETENTQQKLTSEQAEIAWNQISSNSKVAIISHRNPDPDCIGSNLSLHYALASKNIQADSYCIDTPPNSCRFLKKIESFKQELDPEQYDLLISVDCGGTEQLGYEQLQPPLSNQPFINIDHHASNKGFGTLNIVFPNYSSTSEIIFELFSFWGITITPEIATGLLMGLYYDTGSFMHSNVNPKILEIAYKLTGAGANLPEIHKHMFNNFSEDKFHIWGKTLENIRLTNHGTAIAVVEKDKNPDKYNRENFSGLIDYVSMTKDSKFAVMITQEQEKQIHGSLRTRNDDINLSKLAAELGGGGHRKASGFAFPGEIKKQTIWKITNL